MFTCFLDLRKSFLTTNERCDLAGGSARGFLNGSKRELLLEFANVRGSAELQCFLSRMCLPIGCGSRIVWKIQKVSKMRDWLEISHYFERISEVNLEETNLTSIP